jgi:hypothetical protein
MRIGIIGAGQIGGTLAKLFVTAGHEVAVSNSRGPETLASLVAELDGRAQALTAAGGGAVRRRGCRVGSPGSLPRGAERCRSGQGRDRHQQRLPAARWPP